jgi:hypothetical protein
MSTPKKQATTTSSSSSKVHVVNFSSYTAPEIREVQGKEWVEYGDDNNYFQYLIDRYNGSPTNNALINGIVDFIYGNGLDATDSAAKPAEYAAMRGLLNKDCLRKIVADYKMMGQCAVQVVYSRDHNTIAEVAHIPTETLRAEKCNDEGEVEAYYYAKDWSEVANRRETPTRIPAFGTSQEAIEILYIKPYRAGFYYYSPVDYQGGLPYAELEEEVANYHINNIQNSLSPSLLINFNNGVPSEEERRQIEMQIAQKYSGSSNSGKFILAFNDNKELAATVDTIQLSDAASQYQFLSDEATQKLMVAHRITSPMLLGIKDNSGLGNNADELKTASILFDNIVIRPMQEVILEGLNKILSYNDLRLNIYFKTLQPLEFTEPSVQSAAVIEENTGVKADIIAAPAGVPDAEAQEDLIQKEASYNGAQIASSLQIMQSVKDGILTVDQAITFLVQMLQFDPQVAKALFAGNSANVITQMKSHKFKQEVPEFTHEEEHKWIEALRGKGEVVDLDEWELVSDEVVNDPDNEDAHLAKQYNFAVEDFSNADDRSTFDSGLYKIRYAYTRNISANSREFCREMVGAANGGVVFRKEDIDMMSFSGVNGQFAPEGQSVYSIWKWKGGAFCHHAWRRLVYFRKRSGGKFLPNEGLDNDKLVSTEQAIKDGVPTGKLVPNAWDEAQKRPIDTPSRGSLKYG